MAQDFSEDELVYGDYWGLVHDGVLDDNEIERMKALRDEVYGKKGIAITTLKPIGCVEIDGTVYQARLSQGYLDKGTSVIAVGVDTGYVLINELKMEEI